jgi:hypothetical protein
VSRTGSLTRTYHHLHPKSRVLTLPRWSDSQLKAFADKNGIPVPQPRQRDSLLKAVRENYQSAANKLGETAAYPGDWLYSSWSDSDIKAWLDERGYNVPQPSSRDSLVATLRRQSRLASENAQGAYASVSSSAAAAQQSLSDALLDSWSDSQIKEWADSNGIKVPQGSKRNELLALARLYGDSASATVESAYGAATSQAGNQYNAATNGFAGATNWVKAQIGLATDAAYSSATSATDAAGSSASSASIRAAASASSASVRGAASASSLSGAAGKAASSSSSSISKSAASASSVAAKSASSAASAASKSAYKGYSAAAASASSASKKAKDEL